MKKALKLCVLSLIVVSVIGCGNDKKDKPSALDPTSKKEEGTSQFQNDFEPLKEKLVGTKKESEYDYEITVYFEKEQTKNAVMRITCPDVESASMMREALQNAGIAKQAVSNGNLITYDYEDEAFVYKEMTKEQAKTALETEGYEVK